MNAPVSAPRLSRSFFLIALSITLAFAPFFACASALAASQSKGENPEGVVNISISAEEGAPVADQGASGLVPIKGDSAGTVFTFNDALQSANVAGDLIWLNSSPDLLNSLVQNDAILFGSAVTIEGCTVQGDIRGIAPSFTCANTKVEGNISVAGYDVSFQQGTDVKGIYCYAADRIEFDGVAKHAFLYAQTLVINGTINGDATVSAQHIEIGPDAVITGTLHVHSGQNLNVPATASIGYVDVTSEDRNTIDQITEIRSMVAPLFQIGGAVFSLISFAILAAIAAWAVGHKIREANRIVRSHPIPMIILGIALVVGLPLLMVLAAVLVFTIPVALVLALLLVLTLLVSIPFTGASLGLLLPGNISDQVKAVLGTVAVTLFLQVPYVNLVVSLLCCIYFLGYFGYTFNQGHDEAHNAREGLKPAMKDTPAEEA